MNDGYFLPYQRLWLANKSKFKIWEKSRRIGATYVQAYEDVADCAAKRVPAVWFSSSDETAAKEYIEYSKFWLSLLNIVANDLGEVVLESDRSVKTHSIQLVNGTRINALSSNPKAFRSKGGKVVLDEFAFHDDPRALWKAARPSTTWGYPLRILSTHNGQQCLYYKFIEDCKSGKLPWHLQTTNILDAVKDGLVDKIYGRPTTEQERADWLESEKRSCFDSETWLQEYMCIAVDSASAFLPYELIYSCEAEGVLKSLSECTGELYVGVDIGRKKDLTVIWVNELLGFSLYTRALFVLERTAFSKQQEILGDILRNPKIRRCCMDSTGIGLMLSEWAQEQYGKYRVEAVHFTGLVKEELANRTKAKMEDRQFYLPNDFAVREAFHAIRKVTTVAGNIRFDVAANESGGHADHFWAAALSVHAANSPAISVSIESDSGAETSELLRGMEDTHSVVFAP